MFMRMFHGIRITENLKLTPLLAIFEHCIKFEILRQSEG